MTSIVEGPRWGDEIEGYLVEVKNKHGVLLQLVNVLPTDEAGMVFYGGQLVALQDLPTVVLQESERQS